MLNLTFILIISDLFWCNYCGALVLIMKVLEKEYPTTSKNYVQQNTLRDHSPPLRFEVYRCRILTFSRPKTPRPPEEVGIWLNVNYWFQHSTNMDKFQMLPLSFTILIGWIALKKLAFKIFVLCLILAINQLKVKYALI